jgi:hypothetical protein
VWSCSMSVAFQSVYAAPITPSVAKAIAAYNVAHQAARAAKTDREGIRADRRRDRAARPLAIVQGHGPHDALALLTLLCERLSATGECPLGIGQDDKLNYAILRNAMRPIDRCSQSPSFERTARQRSRFGTFPAFRWSYLDLRFWRQPNIRQHALDSFSQLPRVNTLRCRPRGKRFIKKGIEIVSCRLGHCHLSFVAMLLRIVLSEFIAPARIHADLFRVLKRVVLKRDLRRDTVPMTTRQIGLHQMRPRCVTGTHCQAARIADRLR